MPGVSDVMCGKVTAIMNFGAFVLLEDGTSGLVHISEISKNFVKDVNDFLWVGQQVRVVSLATDHDGKKRLSIKKADEILTMNGDPNVNKFRAPAEGDVPDGQASGADPAAPDEGSAGKGFQAGSDFSAAAGI